MNEFTNKTKKNKKWGFYLGWLVASRHQEEEEILDDTHWRRINHFQQVGHLEKSKLLNVRMVASRLPVVAIEGHQIIGRMGADERRHLHFPANRNGTRTVWLRLSALSPSDRWIFYFTFFFVFFFFSFLFFFFFFFFFFCFSDGDTWPNLTGTWP